LHGNQTRKEDRKVSTEYYMISRGAEHVCGETIDESGSDMYIARDPRALQPSEEDEAVFVHDLIRGEICLVKLAPRGQVDVVDDFFAECEDGWTVVAEESIGAMLGPQSEYLLATIRKADLVLVYDEFEDGDEVKAAEAYRTAVEAQFDGLTCLVEDHITAANDALCARGYDGFWWSQGGVSCAYGWELLALAARDLIGSTPEWTQEAYDALTTPWRTAFPTPLHPEDGPLPVATAG
jgi:hypothetical protein